MIKNLRTGKNYKFHQMIISLTVLNNNKNVRNRYNNLIKTRCSLKNKLSKLMIIFEINNHNHLYKMINKIIALNLNKIGWTRLNYLKIKLNYN